MIKEFAYRRVINAIEEVLVCGRTSRLSRATAQLNIIRNMSAVTIRRCNVLYITDASPSTHGVLESVKRGL